MCPPCCGRAASSTPIPFSSKARFKDKIMSYTTQTQTSMETAGDGAGNEFLAFTLGREEYGIDILRVQEIRGYEPVTRIANAPGFIRGVVNLRGVIVAVVDMRIKFNLADPTDRKSTRLNSSHQ